MFVQLSIFGFFNDWMANFAQMPNGHIWIYVVLGAIIFIENRISDFPLLAWGFHFIFCWFFGSNVKRKIIYWLIDFGDGGLLPSLLIC